MLGIRDQLILGVQDHLLSVGIEADGPFENQAHSESYAGHSRSPQPSGKDVAASVDERRLDRPAALPRVDSDRLDDAGYLAAPAGLYLINWNRSFDALNPRPQVLMAGVLWGPAQFFEDPTLISHDGEVWQYRRANLRNLEEPTTCM